MSSADCSKGNVPPAWLCVMERERKNETCAAVNILYCTYVRSVPLYLECIFRQRFKCKCDLRCGTVGNSTDGSFSWRGTAGVNGWKLPSGQKIRFYTYTYLIVPIFLSAFSPVFEMYLFSSLDIIVFNSPVCMIGVKLHWYHTVTFCEIESLNGT